MTTTAPNHPAPVGSPGKFSAARVTSGGDKSAGKALITGDSGVGKTFFLSTIVSDDGRPIFILPIEEGLKGASPLHCPAKFSDGHDNPLLPQTFSEMMAALRVFRTELNVPRPPTNWIGSLGLPETGLERDVLAALVDVYPYGFPIAVLAEKTGIAPSAAANVIEALTRAERVQRRVTQYDAAAFAVRPDKAWRRPHLHFGVDSLSGAETLIHREITGRNQVSSMADKEYNALFIKALPLWQEFRDELDAIRRSGVHVWIVAHATQEVDAAQSSGEIFRALDLMFRGSGKALLEVRQFWRQWADSIYYIVRDVAVTKGSKERRTTASFRGRKLITTETAQCKAKTRLALPPVLPATWDDLREAMKAGTPASPEKLRSRVLALVPRLETADQARVLADVEAAGTQGARLSALLSRVEGLILCAEEARAEAAAAVDDTAAQAPPEDAAAPSDTTPAQTAPIESTDDGHVEGGI